jgi:hypothetical protein
MTARRPVAEQLERQSVVLVDASIPADLTIAQWRRQERPRPARCEHLHDSTSRYDHDRKELTFLLVCPICRTERVVDSIPYEPHFTRQPQPEPAGATIHQLPVRRNAEPLRRAA